MSIQAIARLNATKEVAVTDVKGAVKYIQSVFDKVKLPVKVKAGDQGQTFSTVVVSGKTTLGGYSFEITFAPDVSKHFVVDVLDWDGLALDDTNTRLGGSKIELDVPDLKLTSLKDRLKRDKQHAKLKVQIAKAKEVLDEVLAVSEKLGLAFDLIARAAANNRE